MTTLTPADLRWLDAAARIALPYRGTTAENPTVGALVVSSEGRLLGRGVTAPGGRPHAEPQALAMAGTAAAGATLYVTLEPCHHWGRTPPCVDAVIRSGITRVVCGSLDPDPRTAGQSLEKLRKSEIEVAATVDHKATRRLHEGFFKRVTDGLPFITAKLAVSADGMIGRADKGNVPITGQAAKRWTHMQRALSDAVMVGSTTARLDDPQLTVRLPGLEDRQPQRVVVAGARSLDPSLNLFSRTERQAIVLISQSSEVDSFSQLIDTIAVGGMGGRPNLRAALQALAERGIARIFVEGGAGLTDALLDAGLVDRFELLESDVVIGASGVPATVHQSLPERLAALGFFAVDQCALGCDRLTTFEKAD